MGRSGRSRRKKNPVLLEARQKRNYQEANKDDALQIENYAEELSYENDAAESQSQFVKDRDKKASEYARQIVFVSNLPFHLTLTEIELYFETLLRNAIPPIPRPNNGKFVVDTLPLGSKRGGSNGSAMVAFNSTYAKEYIKKLAAFSNLNFKERQIRVSDLKHPPHGNFLNRIHLLQLNPDHVFDLSLVKCISLQLCTLWPEENTVLWEKNDDITVDIDISARILAINFTLPVQKSIYPRGFSEMLIDIIAEFNLNPDEECVKVEIGFLNLDGRNALDLKRDANEKLVLSIRLRGPPNLFIKRGEKDWVRTSKQYGTQEAFGRCFFWYLTLEDGKITKQLQRFLDQAHASRICHSAHPFIEKMGILNRSLLQELDMAGHFSFQHPANLHLPECAAGLSFRMKLALVCVVSALRFDVLGITDELVELLTSVPETVAIWALLCITKKKHKYYKDPVSVLRSEWLGELQYHQYKTSDTEVEDSYHDDDDDDDDDDSTEDDYLISNTDPLFGVRSLTNTSLIMIARAYITPLRISVSPPEVEGLNRVTRHFRAHGDRFLRVICSNEDFTKFRGDVKDNVKFFQPIERIRYYIVNGLRIAGRHYKYLAHSAGQLRESSCWFYADPDPCETGPDGDYIRNWMGTFSNIRVIAKYASRLGQSFGTSTGTVDVPKYKIIEDLYTSCGKYCFSDGVGRMSPSLARKIVTRLGWPETSYLPSAFQIRFAGAKGMISLYPQMDHTDELHLRKSQIKFEAPHSNIEIMNVPLYMPCFLNRPLVALLESLGVSKEAVMCLVQDMLETVEDIHVNEEDAERALLKFGCLGRDDDDSAGNSPMMVAWDLLQAGVRFDDCKHLQGLMSAVRKSLLTGARNKARILIPDAVCLFGVMDETGSLNDGEVFVQYRKIDGFKSKSKYCGGTPVLVTGDVLIGRNPALHQGDVRVLKAVDVPALYHMVDVVVFPSKGVRPHPSQMAGGDLDGDIFFVIFDQRLLPPIHMQNQPAMNYEAPKPIEKEEAVTLTDLQNFFVDYIIGDILGMICIAHLIHADQSPEGVFCNECQVLAPLSSKAVDFAKTGQPAIFPLNLSVKAYPHWFMRSDKLSYVSTSILAAIFDRVHEATQMADFAMRSEEKISNPRTLVLMKGYTKYVQESWQTFQMYVHHLQQLMIQFGVFDESSFLSGRIEPSQKNFRGRKNGEAQKIMEQQISFLRKSYRTQFFEEFVKDEDKDAAKVRFRDPQEVQKLQKASAWYYVSTSYTDRVHIMKKATGISFPYIVHDLICLLKWEDGRTQQK